jgi:hypothetical protein
MRKLRFDRRVNRQEDLEQAQVGVALDGAAGQLLGQRRVFDAAVQIARRGAGAVQ